MREITRQALKPGVYLTAVTTEAFDLGHLSLHLFRELKRPEAALAAALPGVLTRGTRDTPSRRGLEDRAAGLGGKLWSAPLRFGEVTELELGLSFRDEGLFPRRETDFRGAATLLGELLLTPEKRLGRLAAEPIGEEREALRLSVSTLRERLLSRMCAAEAYGAPFLGAPQALDRVTVHTLTAYYRTLLTEGTAELVYIGSLQPEVLLPSLREAFAALPGGGERPLTPAQVRLAPPRGKPRLHREARGVNAPALAVGWRLGRAEAGEDPGLYGVLVRALKERLQGTGTELAVDPVKGVLTACLPNAPRPEESLEELRRALLEPVTEEELKEARERECRAWSTRQWEARGFALLMARRRVLGGMVPGDVAARCLLVSEEELGAAQAALQEDTVLLEQ